MTYDMNRFVIRSQITDDPKQCDPSIVEWFEAAKFGATSIELADLADRILFRDLDEEETP